MPDDWFNYLESSGKISHHREYNDLDLILIRSIITANKHQIHKSRPILEILEGRGLSEKKIKVARTILLILERLLPNQSWNTRLSFLEENYTNRNRITNIGNVSINTNISNVPFCNDHQRHLMPVVLNTSTIIDNQDYDTDDTISEISSHYLLNNATTWKEYVSESKRNKQWILQEWISATRVWRKRMLQSVFDNWYRITLLSYQADQHYIEVLVLKCLVRIHCVSKRCKVCRL